MIEEKESITDIPGASRECLSTVYKYMRELVCSVQNESHMSPCFSFQCYIRRYFVAKK